MNKDQIHKIKDECLLPDSCKNSGFQETHISWILLTDHYAFKIKKPVKLSFLDFSTPEKRKHFCELELELNRRLAPEMYLDIFPITSGMLSATSSPTKESVIDYAVKMKRMDNEKEMDKMLEKGEVKEWHMERLANKIARFHKNIRIVKKPFNLHEFQEKFSDLQGVIENTNEEIKSCCKETTLRCIEKSARFLKQHEAYINKRINDGFLRDCHGDLNSTNIFLYDDPVIFDCIEFSEDFRVIDILDEIAFLCVDLDFFDENRLSQQFYAEYLKASGIKSDDRTPELLHYYKSYRANVRAKVTILRMQNHKEPEKDIRDAKKYVELMSEYCDRF